MCARKKICIITCTRAEYGYLKRMIGLVAHDADCELQLVVGGAHLCQSQGYTLQQIEQDGYQPNALLDYLKFDNTPTGIAKSMALCQELCADIFRSLQPDCIVVLGDRYELLSICNTALVMRIPIVHISGGDVTIGAIDNEIRNAITMMADLHFPGSKDSADNICRMRGSSDNIYAVGELSLENLSAGNLLSRQELIDSFGWDGDRKWLLVTLHPETKLSVEENLSMANELMEFLAQQTDKQVIITLANTDNGGEQMNAVYRSFADKYQHVLVYPSLGQKNFNSVMRHAYCVIGNSSSGIVEAPYLAIPVINIGHRQEGRYKSPDIVDVPVCSAEALQTALETVNKMHPQPDYYWGSGHSSHTMLDRIKQYLSKWIQNHTHIL